MVVGLVALTSWLLSWSFGKAVTLAPVIVIGLALLVVLTVLGVKLPSEGG